MKSQADPPSISSNISGTVSKSVRVLMVAIAAIAAIGGARLFSQESSASKEGATARKLPEDVYADSRNRLPLVKRDDLDDKGKKTFDEAAGDSRSLAGLQGPSGIRLHSIRLAELQTPYSEYLRFDNGLGPRLTQLAFLVAAREVDSQFEWTSHEPAALKAGVERSLIDIVKYRKPPTGVGEKEAAIIQIGREALGKRKVSPDTFARGLKLFGKETMVNFASFLGYQAQTATLLVIFDQQIPMNQKPLLPMP